MYILNLFIKIFLVSGTIALLKNLIKLIRRKKVDKEDLVVMFIMYFCALFLYCLVLYISIKLKDENSQAIPVRLMSGLDVESYPQSWESSIKAGSTVIYRNTNGKTQPCLVKANEAQNQLMIESCVN